MPRSPIAPLSPSLASRRHPRSCVSLLALVALAACARSGAPPASAPTPSVAAPTAPGTIAQVYYWRALPGKLEEYSRYITDIAEKIDMEAFRTGAFLSVTTFVNSDPATPWTHMRVFVLRDSVQLAGLSKALDEAGQRFEPDSAKRRIRGEYSATLRERVGAATLRILR